MAHTISMTPSNSKTSVNLNKTFNITYGDGSAVVGHVYNETVNLGGVIIRNQEVGAVTQLSGHIVNASVNGIVGLGLGGDTVKPGPVPTTLQNFVFEDAQVTIIYLCAHSIQRTRSLLYIRVHRHGILPFGHLLY